MKILVTGGTGFIGSAFVRLAAAQGHEIAVLSRNRAAADVPESVTILEGDLADPPWPAIEEFAPDTCLHAAWITEPGVYLESPANRDFLAWSDSFISRLCKNGIGHIVGVGTCIEYAPSAEPFSESNSDIAPETLYASCKHKLHSLIEELARDTGASYAWARIFFPYGPGEHPDRLCSHIARNLIAGKPAALRSPRDVLDYIYIDDIASALLTVTTRRAEGPLNIASGVGVAAVDMAHAIADAIGAPENLIQAPEPDSTAPAPRTIVGETSGIQALGWAPYVSLQEGARRLADSVTE